MKVKAGTKFEIGCSWVDDACAPTTRRSWVYYVWKQISESQSSANWIINEKQISISIYCKEFGKYSYANEEYKADVLRIELL